MRSVKLVKYVYVAGPISKGDQFVNVRNGILTGQRCMEHGLVPFVPHLSGLWQMIHPNGYEAWMGIDFDWIDRCDALLRIPGESSGADREVEHAISRGLPVFYSLEALLDHNRRVNERGDLLAEITRIGEESGPYFGCTSECTGTCSRCA